MLSDYLRLAFSNLRHRGIRSWLTLLGIVIGIAAVVALISLGQGLETAITGQFSTLSADRLTIQNTGTGFGPPGSGVVNKLTEHDLEIVESVPGVINVLPRLIRVASVEYNKIRGFYILVSMPSDQKQLDYIYESFNMEVTSGKLLQADDKGKVIIGSDVAETQEFEKDIRVGSNLRIQGEDFEVIGILKETSTFQINSVIMMNEDEMKDILDIGDEIDIIVAQVEDRDRVEEVSEEIARKLRRDRDQDLGEEDFSVETPLTALASINTILNIINIVVSGIAAISLLVGGIGIANTMFTSVLERRKEIGVMKSIGATNKDILYIFIVEAGFLGLVGGLLGVIIGLILAFGASSAADAYFGENLLQVSISYPLVLASMAFSIIIGILSGVIPAFQASRIKPVEALRS